jgi:ABC-type dipeptide/oligopeptide/nickel transport system permease component
MSLANFVIRRVLWSIPLVVLVMLATFALLRGAGGTPFMPPEGYVGVPETYEQFLRDFYHLDEPWLVEFAHYVKNVFTLDFGPSLLHRNLTVDDVVEQAAPITLQLVLLAAAWAIPLGIATGLAAAAYRNAWVDRLLTSTATVFLVVPVFFVAYVTGRYVAREWHLVELGWQDWDTRLVASFVLALAPIGYVARLVRAAVVEELVEDYVRTARAKGLRRRRILWSHVLRNSLTSSLSAAVPLLALLVTGAFFVEDAFGIPGASSFYVEAARTRDTPVLLGVTVVLALFVIVANALADIALALLDPRTLERQ